ncbi:MAG: hypothetical protein PHO53_04985 [Actinomycetota bacterium]|nr:hypothetical protein [Actinomycetota bacterium]
MDEEQPITQPVKRNFLLILLIILLTALVAGGGVYLWQRSYSKGLRAQNQQAQKENKKLQEKIRKLQNQIAQLQAQQEAPAGGEEPINKPGEIEKAVGYIKAVYEKDGKRYLDIDYVQLFFGDEAIKAMIEDGKCPPDADPSYYVPNDWYVRNQNPKIRTFEIAKDALITTTTRLDGSSTEGRIISYKELKQLFALYPWLSTSAPFHIQATDGRITILAEQFIP